MRRLNLSIVPVAFLAKWAEFLNSEIPYRNVNDSIVLLKFNEWERVPVEWVYFDLSFTEYTLRFSHSGKFIKTTNSYEKA